MKLKHLLVVGACGLLITFGLTGCKKKTVEPQKTTQPTAVINQMPLKDRPYVSLVPREDGKEVNLTIYDRAGADELEYELEYQAGSMIQGAFGRIDFKTEKPPVTKALLFGSCSKGKCKYDEGVTGGSLTLRFQGQDEFALKGDFTIQSMAEVEGVFNSRDGRVALDIGPKGLSQADYLVVANTLGLPETIEGEIVAGPYGFFMAEPPKSLKSASLSWQVSNPEEVKVYGYVDGAWQEFKQNRAVDAKRLTVSVDQLTTFVLVK